jgi:poly(ADP-ribose) glycohydrolase
VGAYLHALFTYFERFVDGASGRSPSALLASLVEDWLVTFTLRSLPESEMHLDDIYRNKFLPLKVTRLPEPCTDFSVQALLHGVCVISADKNVGFGSSSTQEEAHVGSSPEACPVVLIMPTLKDTQVLVAIVAEAMISVKGYDREACLDKLLEPDYNPDNTARSIWPRRIMLFMDALELDLLDTEG